MLARIVLVLSILTIAASGVIWLRVEREARPIPVAGGQRAEGAVFDKIAAGGGTPPSRAQTDADVGGYEQTGYAVSQGAQLFKAYNCVGCHAHGGGGIGVAFLDDQWLYGSDPDQVYRTIVEGRPNGMPSFRNKLTERQVWQLTAYVRAMGRLIPSVMRPARDDHMQVRPPLSLQPPQRWGEGIAELSK
jgi:cytochrome c oxidase cbb3-type subunit 3